jgi:hypothetical protein
MQIQTTKVPKENVAGFYSALRELQAYERRAVLGKCMFWPDDCKAPPIASHLLSRSWLEQIADSTHHIVQFRLTTEDRMNKPGCLKAHRVGINTATTFPAFCEQHDNDLFSCLETQTFSATREQLLALTYRSICCEACAKHQVVDCNMKRASCQLKWALETNQEAPPRFAFQMELEKIRCIKLFIRKSEVEDIRRNSRDSLVSYVVRFSKRPTVLVSTTVNPLVTFTGRILERRWDWLTASIIPSGNGGWAVFTWDKSAPKNPSLFVKSFAKVANELKTVALLNFVFESSENIAIAPQWWESLPPGCHKDLLRRYGCSFQRGLKKPAANTLLTPKIPWIDWKPVEGKYI